MKDTNWPYLAGLIDGEGCFALWKYYNSKTTNWQYSFRLCVTNTDLTLMKWLIQHVGGRYYGKYAETDKHKARYEWRPSGKNNHEKIVLAILPYLVIKRQQAEVFLRFLRAERVTQANQGNEKELLLIELRKLNRKGPLETDTQETSLEVMIQSELAGDCESEPVGTLAS